MKAITADEMRSLEKFAVDAGISRRILMEIAGMKLATIALHEIKRARKAVVVCGKGGNGGDGLVAARHLISAGIDVRVFLLFPEDKLSSAEAGDNLAVLKNLSAKITTLESAALEVFRSSLRDCDIVIDAIYGTGFRGEMEEHPGAVIELINNEKMTIKDRRPYFVIAVDVPSGVDATTGEAAGTSVKADITVTFEHPKVGLFKYPASGLAGKIITTGIGIPKPNPVDAGYSAAGKPASTGTVGGVNVIDSRFVSSVMPRMKVDSHKGDRGKVLVIAGSSGMMGAGVMTATSALRAGSGLVTLCVPREIKNAVNTMSLEVIVDSIASLDRLLEEANAVAIGPGLKKGGQSAGLVKKVLLSKRSNAPVVLDAEALNSIKDPSIFKSSHKNIVITPHPGEFARLAGKTVEEVQKNRMKLAAKFAADNGVTVVLKGAYTVIAGPGGKLFISPVGNPGMATAGAGDVLTGIIASLIGQGIGAYEAAVAGAYIHGMAANLTGAVKGEHGMIAGDIIESIPFAIDSII